MTKRTSGIQNKVLNSRVSETKGLLRNTIKRCAFTLAEVLITLAIIGVVAALTIPVVVHKYQQKQYYTQFMKIYSTLQSMMQLTTTENGSFKNLISQDISPNEFFETYHAPYLKVSSVQDLPDYMTKSIDGSDVMGLNTLISSNAPYNSDKYYILSDGSAIGLAMKIDGRTILFVDTNGIKAPNTFGRDIFDIEIRTYSDKDYVVKCQYSTGENNENCSVDGSGTAGIKGLGCADRLLKEGKMDY